MPPAQKKTKIMVSVDTEDLGDLNEICANHRNLNANQILAIAAGELAKIKGRKDDNIFNALSRISEEPDGAKSSAPARSHRSRSAAIPAA